MFPARKPGQGNGIFGNYRPNMGMVLGGIARMSGDKNTGAFDQMAAQFEQQRAQKKKLDQMMADPQFRASVPKEILGMLPYMSPQAAAQVAANYAMRSARTKAESSKPKHMTIGGQLLEVGPDGNVRVLHSAPGNDLDNDLKRARLLKLEREAKGSGQVGPYKDLKERAGVAAGLRKEYTNISQEYRKVRDSWGRIEATKSNAAGDLALIFNYMKMLDPGSTVREGEFANAENSQGVGLRIRTLYNKILRGERLAPEMRDQFKDQAKTLYERQRQQFDITRKQYGGIAERFGLDPRNIIPDFSERGTRLPSGVTVREIK